MRVVSLELRRDGIEAERHNRLNPGGAARRAYVDTCLGDARPVAAATDYVRALPDGIGPWVNGPYTVLGTDGYGRSDRRQTLRRFFEVNRHHVVVAALSALGRAADAAIAMAATASTPTPRRRGGGDR